MFRVLLMVVNNILTIKVGGPDVCLESIVPRLLRVMILVSSATGPGSGQSPMMRRARNCLSDSVMQKKSPYGLSNCLNLKFWRMNLIRIQGDILSKSPPTFAFLLIGLMTLSLLKPGLLIVSNGVATDVHPLVSFCYLTNVTRKFSCSILT